MVFKILVNRSLRQFSTSLSRNVKNNSFTSVISDELASKSPQLITLHNRLSLPSEFKLSTLARCLTCVQYSNNKYPNNLGLSIFGKNLLTYHITEYFLMKFPRLPLTILNSAVNSLLNENSLYAIGKSWGIEIDNKSSLEKYLQDEPEQIIIGRLRFDTNETIKESGLVEYNNSNKTLSKQMAMASAVKSIIGSYYASTKSLSLTKDFIHDFIINSQKLDIQKLFIFDQPTRELSVLCKRENLQPPVSRLLSEAGRHSKRPVFLVGVFSGSEKLGESFGASLMEAKIRASVNALMNWYLYSPLDIKLPSDLNYSNPNPEVDHGVVIV